MMADWQGYFDVQEESADAIVTPQRPNGWVDGGTYQRMHKHEWTSEDWQPWNLWNNCYKGINTANRVMYQIQSGQIPMTVGKDALLAELRTVRAFYYYLLCDNHGNIPLVTDYTSKEVPLQSTQLEIYNFVIKELTESIPLLSEEVSTVTYGRFTKWGAKTLLARVYLNSQFYTGTGEWAKCLALCNEVIASGKYILEPNYKASFLTKNETSREIIFAVPYDEILGPGFGIHMTLGLARRRGDDQDHPSVAVLERARRDAGDDRRARVDPRRRVGVVGPARERRREPPRRGFDLVRAAEEQDLSARVERPRDPAELDAEHARRERVNRERLLHRLALLEQRPDHEIVAGAAHRERRDLARGGRRELGDVLRRRQHRARDLDHRAIGIVDDRAIGGAVRNTLHIGECHAAGDIDHGKSRIHCGRRNRWRCWPAAIFPIRPPPWRR